MQLSIYIVEVYMLIVDLICKHNDKECLFQDNEVREFTGWIQGRPEDYIMNLQRQQHRQ